MTENYDLVLAQMFPQILSHIYAIPGHAINGHRRSHRFACFSQRSAGAPLVPLHYGEVFFPGSKEQERPRIRYITWTAVQKQQHGIAAVLAADRDPLFDSTDTDVAA